MPPGATPLRSGARKLKQDVLHLHRRASDLKALRLLVTEFLQQFAAGSNELLR
jgi:hypothetical protein